MGSFANTEGDSGIEPVDDMDPGIGLADEVDSGISKEWKELPSWSCVADCRESPNRLQGSAQQRHSSGAVKR